MVLICSAIEIDDYFFFFKYKLFQKELLTCANNF